MPFASMEVAIGAIAAGQPVVVVDDERRENLGYLRAKQATLGHALDLLD
jgi:3,4-dihydroxy-2-butanone 4-phosphate synthase